MCMLCARYRVCCCAWSSDEQEIINLINIIFLWYFKKNHDLFWKYHNYICTKCNWDPSHQNRQVVSIFPFINIIKQMTFADNRSVSIMIKMLQNWTHVQSIITETHHIKTDKLSPYFILFFSTSFINIIMQITFADNWDWSQSCNTINLIY